MQYAGKDILCKDVLEKALKEYEGTVEKKAKTMDIYIKPEDNAAYVTADGVEIAKIDLF